MTPWAVDHQAPLSMVFSRQEYWSGLSLPSPGDLPNPGIEPTSPASQEDSLLPESPRKPKNTVVGSLSLLQRIFPTKELNQGLLHCRQILYQLKLTAMLTAGLLYVTSPVLTYLRMQSSYLLATFLQFFLCLIPKVWSQVWSLFIWTWYLGVLGHFCSRFFVWDHAAFVFLCLAYFT